MQSWRVKVQDVDPDLQDDTISPMKDTHVQRTESGNSSKYARKRLSLEEERKEDADALALVPVIGFNTIAYLT